MSNCQYALFPQKKMAKIPSASFEGEKSPATIYLQHVDWGFESANTGGNTHRIHSYPAKFIPQIPRQLIEMFTSPGEVVYDPFVGSGTTCVEANIIGRNALGNDASELATLITRVKTTPLYPDDLFWIQGFIEDLKNKIQPFLDGKLTAQQPEIDKSESWFEPHVIAELSFLKKEIDAIQNAEIMRFCQIALSSIIISVSKQDSDTRYARIKKDIRLGDVFIKFKQHIKKMCKAMSVSHMLLEKGQTEVKTADTREPNIFKENIADFIVTSPPYPNAYDYHLYHKHRMRWLGMSPEDLRHKEIGAHAKYSRKSKSNRYNFGKDMQRCLSAIRVTLKEERYMAMIIGDSIIDGEVIRNDILMREIAEDIGFSFEGATKRNIATRKKSFNPTIGRLKTEHILIFKNRKSAHNA